MRSIEERWIRRIGFVILALLSIVCLGTIALCEEQPESVTVCQLKIR
jgi:hypothetical protein